ncbi:MAG: GNAT family N-acetyltransferase [Nevskia sp.]|jgi:RimJ/RimL family protein N-acetyltransferase|nr:GNAT family N-acetyltransferase [Nevskia sp.]MCK9384316.1 GNAT family N-acetyltransferase [Nevskia sp.]
MNVLETERLQLRRLVVDDAPFIFDLLNQPSWLRYIGDKGIRTLDDARNYIVNGPMAMYQRNGFGLYLTVLKEGGAPIGLCGLIKRDTLDDVDIGFAFHPDYWNCGYALEAAAAVLTHGLRDFNLPRVVAIASQDNDSSIRLLEKIGLRFQRRLQLTPDSTEVSYFVHEKLAA